MPFEIHSVRPDIFADDAFVKDIVNVGLHSMTTESALDARIRRSINWESHVH